MRTIIQFTIISLLLAVLPGNARETCEGRLGGSRCWMELENRPKCYVWEPSFVAGVTAEWDGECSHGTAHGEGTLKTTWF